MIKILDETKLIEGLNWNQFCEKLRTNGWANPETDDFFRAYYNLFNPKNNIFTEYAVDLINNGFQSLNDLGKAKLFNPIRDYYFMGENKLKDIATKKDEESLKFFYNMAKSQYPDLNVSFDDIPEDRPENINEVEQLNNNINNNINNNDINDNNIENHNINENVNLNNNNNNIRNINENVNLNNNNNIQNINEIEQEDPNLIPILDPNKVVSGMNWQQFTAKMAEKGWPEPEKDNTLRALYNLSSDENNLKGVINQSTELDYRNKNPEDIEQDYRLSIRNSIVNEYLVPAKEKRQFNYNPDFTKSILFIQKEVNEKQQYHYDYEKYVREGGYEQQLREQQNRVQENENRNIINNENNNINRNIINNENNINNNLNNNNNNEINTNNNEENIINNSTESVNLNGGERQLTQNERNALEREDNDNPLDRPTTDPSQPAQDTATEEGFTPFAEPVKIDAQFRKTVDEAAERQQIFDEMADSVHKTYQKLYEKKNTLSVINRNSEEYRNLLDGYEKLDNYMQMVKNTDREGVCIGPEVLKNVQKEFEQVRALSDTYIDAKKKEAKGNLKNLASDTRGRYLAVNESLNTLDENMKSVNDLQTKMENEPPRHFRYLCAEAIRGYRAIQKSRLMVAGSTAFDEADDQAFIVKENIKDIYKKTQNGEELSPGDVMTLAEQAKHAKAKIGKYLELHEGEMKQDKRRAARIHAMRNEMDALNDIIRSCEAVQDEFEKQPAKSISDLQELSEETLQKIHSAAGEVTWGSSEFKDARKQADFLGERINELNSQGADYKPTPEEIMELEVIAREAERRVNAYMKNHHDDLSPGSGTKIRMEAMRSLGTLAAEAKRKAGEYRKLQMGEKDFNPTKMSREEYDTVERLNSSELSSLTGSKEFKNARDAYEVAVGYSIDLDRNKTADKNSKDYKNSIKALKEAKARIAEYIDKKYAEKVKKGKLDAKSTKRLNAMIDAYNRVERRIAYYDKKFGKSPEPGKEDPEKQKKSIKENKAKFTKDLDESRGVRRTVNFLASDALTTLEKFSRQKSLTPAEKKVARRAIAAIMNKNLDKNADPNLDKFKIGGEKITPQKYANMITEWGKDPNMLKLFPDKALTPAMCGKIAANPASLDKPADALYDKIPYNQKFMIPLTAKEKELIEKNPEKAKKMYQQKTLHAQPKPAPKKQVPGKNNPPKKQVPGKNNSRKKPGGGINSQGGKPAQRKNVQPAPGGKK